MRRTACVGMIVLLTGGLAFAAEGAALDQDVWAAFANNKTEVFFNVCGTLGHDMGCYGTVTLKPPFDYACGVLQGKSRTSGNTVTRDIYVLDKRTSSTVDMMLYVYKRTDVISKTFDHASATLKSTVDLKLTGGSGAHCMLAGNDAYVYATTDASSGIAVVSKHGGTLSSVNVPAAGLTAVSIMADDRGYVVTNFSDGTFDIYDPDGKPEEEGGGNYAFVNLHNGWIQN